jgi:hypothetical protein
MLTISDLHNYLNTNTISDDTVVVLYNPADMSVLFVKDFSYLNIEGTYTWTTESGEELEGVHGDYTSTIELYNGTIKLNHKFDKMPWDFNYMHQTPNGIDLSNFKTLKNKLDKMKPHGESKLCSYQGWTIEGIEMLPTDTAFFYKCPYGHSVEINPTLPVLAFVIGEKIHKKFTPERIRESKNVLTWNQFKNK